MSSVSRKQCADCGQRSLETEVRCWACGSTRFLTPGVQLAGEPTLAFGSASDVTLSWSAGRRLPSWAYVAAGIGLAVCVSLVSFWIGRASASSGDKTAPEQPQVVSGPVSLPPPPSDFNPPPTPAPMVSPGTLPSYPDPPVVTIQTQPSRTPAQPRPTPPAAAQPPGTRNPAAPPSSLVYPLLRGQAPPPAAQPGTAPPVRPSASPQINPQMRPAPPAPRPEPRAPAVKPDAAAPSRSTAVVALRNDSSQPVEVTLDGNGSRTAWIAPGGTVPLRLSPGSYKLRATADQASSAQSTMALASNRTYSLLVSRMRENGKDQLVLIEPLEPGLD